MTPVQGCREVERMGGWEAGRETGTEAEREGGREAGRKGVPEESYYSLGWFVHQQIITYVDRTYPIHYGRGRKPIQWSVSEPGPDEGELCPQTSVQNCTLFSLQCTTFEQSIGNRVPFRTLLLSKPALHLH